MILGTTFSLLPGLVLGLSKVLVLGLEPDLVTAPVFTSVFSSVSSTLTDTMLQPLFGPVA